MASPKPTALDVAVDVFTTAGTCRGTLRVPPGTTMLEHVNRAGEHLRLADAHVEDESQGIPFLAVRRNSVNVIVPRGTAGLETAAHRGTEDNMADVAGVLEGLRFQGKVHVAPGQRLTDFFAAAPAFVAVRDCSVWRSRAAGAEPLRTAIALVRAHAVVAFSDMLD